MKATWIIDCEFDPQIVLEILKPASFETIIAHLAGLAQLKPHFQADEVRWKVTQEKYAEYLDGLSEVALHRVMKKLVDMDGKYFPEPSVVNELAQREQRGIEHLKYAILARKKTA